MFSRSALHDTSRLLTPPCGGLYTSGVDKRGDSAPVDALLALALVHHLATASNLPVAKIATQYRRLGRNLIGGLIPMNDSQVPRLRAAREDTYPAYHVQGFEAGFSRYPNIERREPITRSERISYLRHRRTAGEQ